VVECTKYVYVIEAQFISHLRTPARLQQQPEERQRRREWPGRYMYVCIHAVGSQDSMSPARVNVTGFALTATIFNVPKQHSEPTLSTYMYVW